jgi:microcompartment protein CcmK/EutM
MRLARVIGTLVSTVQHEAFRGSKILWVQPVDAQGQACDSAFLAVDGAQAGVGCYVLVVQEGKSARQVMERPDAPCEAIIVGVVDFVSQGGRQHSLPAVRK